MNTSTILEQLRNIDSKKLSEVMNIKYSMARKYKKEPWKYDPPTSKSIAVELAFGIPVHFWKDIKSYIDETISSIPNEKQLHEKGCK